MTEEKAMFNASLQHSLLEALNMLSEEEKSQVLLKMLAAMLYEVPSPPFYQDITSFVKDLEKTPERVKNRLLFTILNNNLSPQR